MAKNNIDYSFLSLLPKAEIEFTLAQIEKISVQSPLPQLLEEITQVFSDKTYGLAESILSEKGYRYPHEVDKQRFCAEEALKNYILARTLKLPAVYCETADFKQRGMAHDVVLVPQDKSLYMMDWGCSLPVRLKGRAVYDSHGKLLSSHVSAIENEQVFARLKAFRKRNKLLQFFDTPQLLYRTTREYGEADETLLWNANKKEFIFNTTITNFEFELSTYRKKKVKVWSRSIIRAQEWGCDSKPIKRETPHKTRNLPFWENLSEAQQTALALGSSYYLILDGSNNHKYISSESQRVALLSTLRENKQSPDPTTRHVCRGYLEFYRALQSKVSPFAATRYLDILAFKLDFASEGKKMPARIHHILGASSPMDLEKRVRTTLLHSQQRYYDSREAEIEHKLVALARRT